MVKRTEAWKPTKYTFRGGELRASRDPQYVSIYSRLVADIVARRWGPALREHARGVLADLGCGRVPLYEAYRDLVSDVICVDWADSFHPNEHLDFECDLTQPLPLADGSVDTVVLSSVLEHVPEPASLWRELQRILRTGGKLLVSVPFYYPLHEIPHDYYRYTEFALRRFADTSGFQVVSLEPLGGAPVVLTDVLAKNLRRAGKHVGPAAARLLQDGVALSLRLPRVGRFAGKTATTFPVHYFGVFRRL